MARGLVAQTPMDDPDFSLMFTVNVNNRFPDGIPGDPSLSTLLDAKLAPIAAALAAVQTQLKALQASVDAAGASADDLAAIDAIREKIDRIGGAVLPANQDDPTPSPLQR